MRLRDVEYAWVATPLGGFLVATRDGAVKGGWFKGQKYFPEVDAKRGWHEASTLLLAEAARQLHAWFADRNAPLDLPLAPEGTEFQHAVWNALRAVPCGETVTYAGIARAIGRPEACHAVGAAVGRNPISLLVPCHRALGSNGSLTGYAGGLARKRWLLDHERGLKRLFA